MANLGSIFFFYEGVCFYETFSEMFGDRIPNNIKQSRMDYLKAIRLAEKKNVQPTKFVHKEQSTRNSHVLSHFFNKKKNFSRVVSKVIIEAHSLDIRQCCCISSSSFPCLIFKNCFKQNVYF